MLCTVSRIDDGVNVLTRQITLDNGKVHESQRLSADSGCCKPPRTGLLRSCMFVLARTL